MLTAKVVARDRGHLQKRCTAFKEAKLATARTQNKSQERMASLTTGILHAKRLEKLRIDLWPIAALNDAQAA